jgi:hypothetical protein
MADQAWARSIRVKVAVAVAAVGFGVGAGICGGRERAGDANYIKLHRPGNLR